MQPQGSTAYFERTWNASLGGFQIINAAAKASDATNFYLDSVCDDNICGLMQLAFNYTCPDDDQTTAYRAWTEDLGHPAPVTFFDAASEAALAGSWFRVVDFDDSTGCDVDVLVWNDHDFSDPFLVDGKLWLGGSGRDTLQLERFGPVVAH